MKELFKKYYYKNTNKYDHRKTNNLIKKHREEKQWYVSLYFDTKRLAKYQRNKKLFWDGNTNDFTLCKTSDLTKYNGLYTFDEAFKLFENFNITDEELIRLNYNGINNGCDEFCLVRS